MMAKAFPSSSFLLISLSKIFNSRGFDMTKANNTARTSLGTASFHSVQMPSLFLILDTINRSRLNITKPHKSANNTAIHTVSNMVYKAYPAERAANIPVNITAAPIPTYLFDSDAPLFRRGRNAPLQNHMKVLFLLIRCSNFELYNLLLVPNRKLETKIYDPYEDEKTN